MRVSISDTLAEVRRFILLIAAGIFASAAGAGPAEAKKGPKKPRPVQRLDRTRAVGAPVLDEKAKPGIYVWLEDGAFRVAAVPFEKKRRDNYVVKLRGSKKLKVVPRGDFAARGGGKSVTLRVRAKEEVAKSAVETEGDLEIYGARSGSGKRLAIFVGPLAKRAASSVRIGRF